MAASIRGSKFRHVFGTEAQAAEIYRDIRHGSFGMDGSALKASATHFAVAYPGVTGAVCVVGLDQKGAIDHESHPLLVHPSKQEVLDSNFSRNNPRLFITSHGNGDLALWDIPEAGTKGINTAPSQIIEAHAGKRITIVDWHPLANNLVVSVDSTKVTKLFDIGAGSEVAVLPNPYKGLVTSVAWSARGDQLVTYAKDKKLRLFDPRANACTAEVEDHQGVKAGAAIWCNNTDRIFTVGHDKSQNRGFSLWDPRKLVAGGRLSGETLAGSSSSLIPLLDQDTSVLFLGSRGEGSIRTYEVTGEGVFPLGEFASVDPTSGYAALPKTSCNVEKNEIFRLLKLVPSKNIVLPIRFEIPRVASGLFQDDLFPDTWDGKASMSAAEWLGGANTPGHLLSLAP